MAVTYAWRLDSDKYAYILPPYPLKEAGVSSTYGFLSKSPLTGYALRNVAESAETQFGKDSEGGLNAYTTAFTIMEAKIKAAASSGYTQTLEGGTEEVFSGWGNLQNADLLSADVYYNVDSTNCADLRGVGIKGTRYLGSFPSSLNGVNIDNITYEAGGTAGKMGYTDVYGIYLTDNIEDNGTVTGTTNTPEYMFVIRNGEKGEKGDTGPAINIKDSGVTEALVTKDEFNDLTKNVAYKTEIENINKTLGDLVTAYTESISLDNINSLQVMVSRLQQQMASMQEYIFSLKVTLENAYDDSNGNSGGGTAITAVPLGIVKDLDGNEIHNDYEFTGTTVEDGNIEGWERNMRDISSKKFHLLGYLEEDNNYLTSNGRGYRNNVILDKLYILPNIGVSLTGITFGVESEYTMNVDIQGDVSMNNMSVDNKAYASSGFYQSTPPKEFGTVENVEQDDFKEPNFYE